MTLFSTVLLLAAASAPASAQEPSAADWSKRLAGADRGPARRELVALGRKAAPILAEIVVAGASDDAAWQAVMIFAELRKDAKAAVRDLDKALVDEKLAIERRALAALALGGIDDKAALKALAGLLEERVPPELSVAARVALGNLGKSAAKPTALLMKSDDAIVRQWGAQVLYVLGPRATMATKALCAQLEENSSYPLYATVKLALEAIGQPAQKQFDKAWKNRMKILPRQIGGWLMPPKVYTDNEMLMNMMRSKSAAGMANEDVPTHLIPQADEMALPKEFHDFNQDGYATVSEVFMVWASHIAVELAVLHETAYSPNAPATFEEWRKLALPVEKSCVGIETLAPIRANDVKKKR